MPTTAWSTMRPDIARELGYHAFTSDNITTTTVVDASLGTYFPSDDYFNGWYALIEAGTNAGAVRRASDYTASSGTITIAGPTLTADATARACSLHAFPPERLQDLYNRVRQLLFPQICIVRDYRSLVTGQRQFRYLLPTTLRGKPLAVFLGNRDVASQLAENLFDDPGFEDWASATSLNKWTLAGTGASVNREQETTTPANFAVLQDSYSARVYSASSGETTLLQTVTPDQATQGVEVNISAWVYCLTSGRVSLRIGSSDGTTHGGTGWELLTQAANLGGTATNFSAGVVCSAGAQISFYVDEAFAVLGQSEAADREWTPLSNWGWVPAAAGASDNGYLEIPYSLPAKRRIRVLGRDLLSSLSTDAGTIEIDGEYLEVVYNKVRQLAAQQMVLQPQRLPEDRALWEAKAREFGERVSAALDRGVRVRPSALQIRIPDWEW